MFEELPPEIGELPGLADAQVVDAIGGWARIEAAACARKHAAMADLFVRRTGCDTAEDRDDWWADPCAAVGAEIGAAQNISSGLALFQTQRAVALLDRLPRVAALFADGLITELLVRAIVSRTDLITAPDVMAKVDVEIAARARRWGRLSASKTETAIDAVVEQFDAGALRRVRSGTRARDVEIITHGQEPGLAGLWGRLYAGHALALDQRLREIADSVCEDDPRTVGERRADAMGALAAGLSALRCECGEADCSAASRERPDRRTTVYVIADEAAVPGRDDQADADPTDGQVNGECRPAAGDEVAAAEGDAAEPVQGEEMFTAGTEAPAPTAEPSAPASRLAECRRPMAFVLGAGVLNTALLSELTVGAHRRTVRHPGDDTPPEPHYTPSAALAAYVRCRDLTCRFPGCDRPADRTDIDHTIPYPAGPTHASNLKCLCRFHHLLKTFWVGPNGWSDVQYPDGTVEWTSPTGHVYVTRPGSADVFPALCRSTGELPIPGAAPPPPSGRGLCMPRRKRTRAQNRHRRIMAERKLNDESVAERNRPPPF